MLVVFANNQLMLDYDQGIAVVYTDPVLVGDNNQATGTTTVHRIFNYATSYGLQWTMQVSNDGVNYVSQGPAALPIQATGISW